VKKSRHSQTCTVASQGEKKCGRVAIISRILIRCVVVTARFPATPSPTGCQRRRHPALRRPERRGSLPPPARQRWSSVPLAWSTKELVTSPSVTAQTEGLTLVVDAEPEPVGGGRRGRGSRRRACRSRRAGRGRNGGLDGGLDARRRLGRQAAFPAGRRQPRAVDAPDVRIVGPGALDAGLVVGQEDVARARVGASTGDQGLAWAVSDAGGQQKRGGTGEEEPRVAYRSCHGS